ncbi:MAG: FecR domain-containing protein [Lentisphaeraceae bacterium]|nr:FecR domain-containing protein [Lentisphaeraceae bacterium]
MSEDLFDKYLNNSLSESEEKQLHDLLQDDQAGAEFVDYCLEMHASAQVASDLLEGKTSQSRLDTKTISFHKHLPKVLALAAALILVLWVSRPKPVEPTLTKNRSLESNSNLLTSGMKITTEKYAPYKLDDGSKIEILGNAKVRSNKEIFLKSGIVIVTAQKQINGQLKVVTEDATATVVGTQFTVRKLNYGTSLEVSEGTVAFTHKDKQETLTEGEAAIASSGKIIKSKKGLNYLRYKLYTDSIRQDKSLKFFMNMEKEKLLEVQGFTKGRAELTDGHFVDGRTPFTKALKGVIRINNSVDFNLSLPATYGAWISMSEASPMGAILTKGDTSFRLQLCNEGQRLHAGFGRSMNAIDGDSYMPLKKWHFVTFSSDGDKARLYINGQLESERKIFASRFKNEFPIMIGTNAQVPERIFTGLISEPFIIQRALSATEIRQLYLKASIDD